MSEEILEMRTAAQIAAELKGPAIVGETPEDPKDAKVFVFDFEYKDARGKVWAGKFTNHILTVRQKRLLKVTKAKLSGGVSVASLDVDIWQLNEMLAHLMLSLDQQAPGFPSWARDLEELFDEQIIERLYEEVASHEARFHRRGEAQEESA